MHSLTPTDMQKFNYLVSEIDAAYHEAAQRLGLSDSTLQILYVLCNHGEQCLLSDICKLSGTSKQTINSAIRKLEAEGMIYLETAAGRKKKACLTESGKVLVYRTIFPLIQIENDIFDSWPEPDRTLYLELTQRYLTSFRNKIKELKKNV